MPVRFKGRILLAAGLSLAGAPLLAPAAAQPPATPSAPASAPAIPATLGREWVYTVRPNDTLSGIAQRHGVDLRRLLAINGLDARKPIHPGQQIHLSNRHIAPSPEGAPIVINIPDALLFHYDDAEVTPYPVALGEPFDEGAADPQRWRTPIGAFTVVEKRVNPVWNVPKSIQEEMLEKGQEVLTKVPPGPKNPLGTRWIGLSAWGYGIHGTNAPTSIGRYTTHGCIRMRSSDVEEIFERVDRGTPVRIVYEPAKLTVEGEEVYLEVSRDVYRRIPNMNAHVQRLLREAGLAERVDPGHVRRAVKGRWGVAVRVEHGAPKPFAKLKPAKAKHASESLEANSPSPTPPSEETP